MASSLYRWPLTQRGGLEVDQSAAAGTEAYLFSVHADRLASPTNEPVRHGRTNVDAPKGVEPV